jgi:hypothetical protein
MQTPRFVFGGSIADTGGHARRRPSQRFGAVRQFASYVVPGAGPRQTGEFRHPTGCDWSNVNDGCAQVGLAVGEAARPPSRTYFVYSQEVQPTAPTRADFSRPLKYDTYPCRLRSTAGKELQNRGPRVRILPPLPPPPKDWLLWRRFLIGGSGGIVAGGLV